MTFWGSNAAQLHTRSRRPLRSWRVALALLASAFTGCAGASALPDAGGGLLRVGTSGDYAPFSVAPDANGNGNDGNDRNGSNGNGSSGFVTPPTGFDPAVASAYAADRGLAIEWVRFRWPDLLADLAANRFDVAMSGVTVRPDRSLAGRFSVSVCQTGALLLIDRQGSAFRTRGSVAGTSRAGTSGSGPSRSDIDRPAVRIAVNAGGHLERVTRRHFPNATVIAVPDNAAVLEKVLDGQADAAASDTQEAPSWVARAPSLEIWGPFTRDQKAYLVRPDRAELAQDLDDWLQAREADGRLAALRSAHLRGEQPALAAPLPALINAIAERLALMPIVAEAKRRSGGAVEVPEREQRVIEAGTLRTRAIAHSRGIAAPDPAGVRALFRAQIEAAKAIQRAVLAGPPAMEEPPDLAGELRPALIRIGDRLAGLIVSLQERGTPGLADGDPDAIRLMTSAALAPHDLDEDHVNAIASAIARVSSTRSAPGGAGAP